MHLAASACHLLTSGRHLHLLNMPFLYISMPSPSPQRAISASASCVTALAHHYDKVVHINQHLAFVLTPACCCLFKIVLAFELAAQCWCQGSLCSEWL